MFIHGVAGRRPRTRKVRNRPYHTAGRQEKNLIFVDKPFKRCRHLDEREFKSTCWQQILYRTRMAHPETAGARFGGACRRHRQIGRRSRQQKLIPNTCYVGRGACAGAGHGKQEPARQPFRRRILIPRSSCDGRFSITYCTKSVSRRGRGVKFG